MKKKPKKAKKPEVEPVDEESLSECECGWLVGFVVVEGVVVGQKFAEVERGYVMGVN